MRTDPIYIIETWLDAKGFFLRNMPFWALSMALATTLGLGEYVAVVSFYQFR